MYFGSEQKQSALRVDRTQLGGELALFMFKLADGVEEIRGPAHCKDHQTLTETE